MSVITSIKGLQNLTNLTDFIADWNGLQSVNLSGLTNLVYVDISDNDISGTGGPSLTSVNLSGCTALQELRLDDSNFSGGIPNLSSLDSLIYMDFDDCGITGSVDISNHPVLEGFDFSQNEELTELIISNAQPLGGNGYELLLGNCALTQTAVDNILIALSESAVTNGYVDLAGGTNASPSQTGIDAANVLSNKSWSFDYNLTATNYTVSNQSSLTRDCELFPNLGLYSLQSNPLEVVRFYNNSNLTSPFLGTADAFFAFVLFDQPENVYTANIDPVTGDVSNVQLCPTPTTTTTTTVDNSFRLSLSQCGPLLPPQEITLVDGSSLCDSGIYITGDFSQFSSNFFVIQGSVSRQFSPMGNMAFPLGPCTSC